MVNAALVPVGAGGYITTLPAGQKSASDQAGNAVSPKVTADFTQLPTTNDWWSSLIWQYDPTNPFSQNLFAHPLSFKASGNGLSLGYPNQIAISPETVQAKGHRTQEYHYNHNADIAVSIAGLASPDTRVSKYSDWCVTAVWKSGVNTLEATIGHGLPFAYFNKIGGDAVITCNATPTIWSNSNGVIGLTLNGRHYGIFLPAGSTVTGTKTFQSSLNGKGYFSIAVLPDNTPATLEFYRKHAYALVTDSKVSWSYDEANAKVNTQFTITTQLQETGNGNVNRPLLALYRHQWLNTDDTLTEYAYVSPRGQMKVLDATTFTTHYTFHGVLPTLPNATVEGLDGFSKTQLYGYVDEIFKQTVAARWPGKDTYWSGKDMGRNAIALQLADQAGHTAARDLLLQELKAKLQDWLDGVAPALYYYDNTWKALIGYPASFGSDTQFNDHHFHWGYAIIAAGIVAQYDPNWASDGQWGGMIQILIKDAANWDKADNKFPFLRMYDVYAGHGWANGPSLFGAGNNQESSSESINFSTGCILFGSATGNKTIRDLGIFLYATEVAAIQQYWFDVDNVVFPADFNKPTLGIVWGNGGAYAIWWDGYVEELHGINFLPVTGGSLHLGLVPDYLKLNQQFMLSNGGGNNSWKDVQMAVKAFYDPQAAIADFNAGYTSESGETRAHTYHWIHSLNALGRIDPTITANIPTYAVFVKNGKKTYVAYNPTSTTRSVQFSDGTTLNVPARSVVTNNSPTPPPPPAPTYETSITQATGAVTVTFKPTNFTASSAAVNYTINGGASQTAAMSTSGRQLSANINGLKNNDVINYSISFNYNGAAQTTPNKSYTYTDNKPVQQFTQGIENIKRITFKPDWSAKFVYILYAINGSAQTAYMMNTDCNIWYHLLPQVKTGDQITYLFGYEYNGNVVYSDEYTATM